MAGFFFSTLNRELFDLNDIARPIAAGAIVPIAHPCARPAHFLLQIKAGDMLPPPVVVRGSLSFKVLMAGCSAVGRARVMQSFFLKKYSVHDAHNLKISHLKINRTKNRPARVRRQPKNNETETTKARQRTETA